MRALPGQRPTAVSLLEPDGQILEEVIADLQERWGMPQSPQEYRITIKVAEEREDHGRRTATVQEIVEDPADDHSVEPGGSPRREKAPAAPRVAGGPGAGGQGAEGTAPRRKSGRRRRGRRGGRGGSGAGTPPSPSGG